MEKMKRKITLYLPNDNFEGLVKITESNGWQFSGQLFSCFRNNLEALLAEKDNLEKTVFISYCLMKKFILVKQPI